MSTEIERKFLVHERLLPALPAPDSIEQGYLSSKPTVRVRLRTAPDGTRSGFLTIKGPGLLTRAEFEYAIPPEDAVLLLALCAKRLSKQRHLLGRWELDWFPGLKLWLAEIELVREDEPFERPAWLAEEVSLDPSYGNASLATRSGPL